MCSEKNNPAQNGSEFNISDPKYPHQHLTDSGEIREKTKNLLKTLKKKEAILLCLGLCAKVRTSEFSGAKLRGGKLHLKYPKKGSKAIRELAKIEPFYSFLMENKALLGEALTKYCVGDKTTYNFFRRICGGGPRTLERATITYLYYQGQKTHAKNVAGHYGNHTQVYARNPNFTVDSVKESLKGHPELLTLFMGVLVANNREIDHLKNHFNERINKLEAKL